MACAFVIVHSMTNRTPQQDSQIDTVHAQQKRERAHTQTHTHMITRTHARTTVLDEGRTVGLVKGLLAVGLLIQEEHVAVLACTKISTSLTSSPSARRQHPPIYPWPNPLAAPCALSQKGVRIPPATRPHQPTTSPSNLLNTYRCQPAGQIRRKS